MNLPLFFYGKNVHGKINISGSKSESNRLLVLQRFFPNLRLENVSNSDDTKHLKEALSSNKNVVNIGHAGTAMRFLTAYFSSIEGREVVLTGSERMQNRPIKILVNALRSIGANISYVDKEGYPPLRIIGCKLNNRKVKINGNVSSQYISALMLIAPSLKSGLEIELLGKVTSIPYLNMTLSLLDQLGIPQSWNGNVIKINPVKRIENKVITVESDWSSASYFYSLVAMSNHGNVNLRSYKKDSLQGDCSLVEIYKHFGVKTEFTKDSICLTKENIDVKPLVIDLVNSPDLAQTIVVTSFGLGVECELTGLHTLKIKETDRLVALKKELEKLGASISITDNSLNLEISKTPINKNISINTYQDHRMAMAFAPLSIKVPITINEAEVVTKSYKDFWNDFNSIFN